MQRRGSRKELEASSAPEQRWSRSRTACGTGSGRAANAVQVWLRNRDRFGPGSTTERRADAAVTRMRLYGRNAFWICPRIASGTGSGPGPEPVWDLPLAQSGTATGPEGIPRLGNKANTVPFRVRSPIGTNPGPRAELRRDRKSSTTEPHGKHRSVPGSDPRQKHLWNRP